MRRRRTAAAVGAAVLAIVLVASGCGGSPSSGSQESGGKVVLDWALWAAGEDEQAQWEHVAELVTKQYPDIELNLRTSPFADYFTKLNTEMAGGQAPCIVTMQSLRLPAFTAVLEPMDELLEKTGFDAAEWEPGALAALQWEGRQLGLPFDIATMLMYYDRNAFEQAGVPAPEPGWTIADFEQDVQQLTGDGQKGFALSFSDLHLYAMLLAYNGARPVSDGGELQLTSDAMQEAFAWYTALATERQLASVPASSSDIPWAEQQFSAGNVPMAVDGTWNLGSYTDSDEIDVGVAPLPGGEDGLTSYVAGSGFAVSKSCGNKEAAAKAISVMTGPDALGYLAGLGRAYPARTAQQQAYFDYLAEDLADHPELAKTAEEALKTAFDQTATFLGTSGWDQVTKLMARHYLPAYTGSSTPQQALETVQQQGGAS